MTSADPAVRPVAPVRRLVVCLDGTNNEIGNQPQPTNVGKTYELLQLSDPTRQRAYYDPGIGTLPDPNARGALGRRVSTLLSLGLGWGVRAKLASAYTWLMNNYEHGSGMRGHPDDPHAPVVPRCEIVVFGFSRGAFTARALVGMLNRIGLLRPGSENLVPYAIRNYTVNQDRFDDPVRRAQTQQFSDAFCWGTAQDPLSPAWPGAVDHQHRHAVPVSYLGVWDTVEAIGRPSRGGLNWDGVHRLGNVQRLRHAVSIDEWRRPFREELVTHPGRNPLVAGRPSVDADIQEAWFPGVHCDAGGTYVDDNRLSTGALEWVLAPVLDTLALRETDSYRLATRGGPGGTTGAPVVHAHPFAWRLAGRRVRTVPGDAWVHASALALRADDPRYRPRNLAGDPTWLHPDDHLPATPPASPPGGGTLTT